MTAKNPTQSITRSQPVADRDFAAMAVSQQEAGADAVQRLGLMGVIYP